MEELTKRFPPDHIYRIFAKYFMQDQTRAMSLNSMMVLLQDTDLRSDVVRAPSDVLRPHHEKVPAHSPAAEQEEFANRDMQIEDTVVTGDEEEDQEEDSDA